MRSLASLDSTDLAGLACPWCGRTPIRATTWGFKAVRDGEVLGMVGLASATDLGGLYPQSSIVITQVWVRPADVGELIGTQLIHRVAAVLQPQRVRCLVAPGTRGTPDCSHAPAGWLESLGFTESVAGVQWRLDLRRLVRLPEVVQTALDAAVRLVRPGRTAPASRS